MRTRFTMHITLKHINQVLNLHTICTIMYNFMYHGYLATYVTLVQYVRTYVCIPTKNTLAVKKIVAKT